MYGISPKGTQYAIWSCTYYFKWGQFGAVDVAPFFILKVEAQKETFVLDARISYPNKMGSMFFSLKIKSNAVI